MARDGDAAGGLAAGAEAGAGAGAEAALAPAGAGPGTVEEAVHPPDR